MSRSIHTTYRELRSYSKADLYFQMNDTDSILSILSKKSALKKNVLKIRRQKKMRVLKFHGI